MGRVRRVERRPPVSPILDTDRLIRPTTAAAILGVPRDGIH